MHSHTQWTHKNSNTASVLIQLWTTHILVTMSNPLDQKGRKYNLSNFKILVIFQHKMSEYNLGVSYITHFVFMAVADSNSVFSYLCLSHTASFLFPPAKSVSEGAPGSFNSLFLPLSIFVFLSQCLSWGLNIVEVSLLKWKMPRSDKLKDRKEEMRGGDQRCS